MTRELRLEIAFWGLAILSGVYGTGGSPLLSLIAAIAAAVCLYYQMTGKKLSEDDIDSPDKQ